MSRSNTKVPNMESRQLEILRAIVDEYVATEEPVGSKSIAERHDLGISPATIRNEMAVLEEAGLITQPHTSAGRIPTNLGYRIFVDKLATIKPFSGPERRAIETFLEGAGDLDEVMARTVRLLAQITKQVAVVQYPAHSDSKSKVALAGTANLARSNHEHASDLHPILEALEEQVVLLRLLSEVGDSMQVRIGDEQSEKNLQTTSLVSMSYGKDGIPAGALGIIGLTRMDYAGSMSAVSAVARYVGKFLGDNK